MFKLNEYMRDYIFFTIHRCITNSQCDQLAVGLVAQLVKH